MSIPITASSPPTSRSAASRSATCRRATTGRASSRWTSRGTRAQRKTVSPMFTPTHLDELAILIRERAGRVLDALPRNETFNFVDRVSIELTTQMLATLFDFPWEERRKLTRWSDVSTALPKSGIVEIGRTAPRRDGRMRGLFRQALERARQCRAAQRPDLDDGAQRRHAAHGSRQSDGQHHPA